MVETSYTTFTITPEIPSSRNQRVIIEPPWTILQCAAMLRVPESSMTLGRLKMIRRRSRADP
jgi:hypothetical protein